jgi:hypothetical protein
MLTIAVRFDVAFTVLPSSIVTVALAGTSARQLGESLRPA